MQNEADINDTRFAYKFAHYDMGKRRRKERKKEKEGEEPKNA